MSKKHWFSPEISESLCAVSVTALFTVISACAQDELEQYRNANYTPAPEVASGDTVAAFELKSGALATDPMREIFSKPQIRHYKTLPIGGNAIELRGYDENYQPMGVYAYAPSIRVSAYGSNEVFMFYCRYGDLNSWDKIALRKSTDWGVTWGPERIIFQAKNQASLDRSACDPDVLQIKDKFVLFYTGNNRDNRLKPGVPDYCTDPLYTNAAVEKDACGQSAIFYAVSSNGIEGPYVSPAEPNAALLVTRERIGELPKDAPYTNLATANKYGAGQSSAVVNPENPNEIWLWFYDDSKPLPANEGELQRVNLAVSSGPGMQLTLSVSANSRRVSKEYVNSYASSLYGVIAPEVRYNVNTKNLELLYFGDDDGHHGKRRILKRRVFDPSRSSPTEDFWEKASEMLDLQTYGINYVHNPGLSGTFTGAYDGESYILGFGQTKSSCIAQFQPYTTGFNDCLLKTGDLALLHVRDTLKSFFDLPTLDANFYQPNNAAGQALTMARGTWTASHAMNWCNYDLATNPNVKDCLFNGLSLKTNQYLVFFNGQLAASAQGVTQEGARADCVQNAAREDASTKRRVECFLNGQRIVAAKYKIEYVMSNSYGMQNPAPVVIGEGFAHYDAVLNTCKSLPATSDRWRQNAQSYALYYENLFCYFDGQRIN